MSNIGWRRHGSLSGRRGVPSLHRYRTGCPKDAAALRFLERKIKGLATKARVPTLIFVQIPVERWELGKRHSTIRTEHRLEASATLDFRTVERSPRGIPEAIVVPWC